MISCKHDHASDGACGRELRKGQIVTLDKRAQSDVEEDSKDRQMNWGYSSRIESRAGRYQASLEYLSRNLVIYTVNTQVWISTNGNVKMTSTGSKFKGYTRRVLECLRKASMDHHASSCHTLPLKAC